MLRIALAQVNPTVGDVEGNAARIAAGMAAAREAGAGLVAFPELAVTGYPPEDLLLKPAFIERNLEAVRDLAGESRGLTALVGFVDWEDDLHNAAAVLHDGEWIATYHKMYLPNYGVFDEDRYFRAGGEALLLRLGDVPVGVTVCEDAWYPVGPLRALGLAGAVLIVNLNASPYHFGKGRFRETMLATRASDNAAALAYVNAVGGQDELVFDGRSLVFGPDGRLLARARAFEEDLLLCDLDPEAVRRWSLHDPRKRKERARPGGEGGPCGPVAPDLPAVRTVALPPLPPASGPEPAAASGAPRLEPPLEPLEEVWRALVLGTRDYVRKNGFERVVLGLSGGIDSSLVACVAVDALGAENVTGVFMPSRYTSPESREDALALARNLGVRLLEIPIDGLFQRYLDALAPLFAGRAEDTTEENVQARVRGNLLMALSNKFGWLVLSTGDKSETSVGYMTLYGDMAGGFAVIKDVPKTLAYDLARHRNRAAAAAGAPPPVPERVLTKPPSPELKADQRATDTLPPYEVLDPILKAYVEEDRSAEEIARLGFPEDLVRRVVRMVDRAEYKRRQAPPGIRISPRAFGRDRRMPITNRFRG